jgi:hypothetical protein
VDTAVLDAGGAPTEAPPARVVVRNWTRSAGVLALLGLWSAALSIVFWPGQVDPDTTTELQHAATGKFTDWHAPVLELLWRGLYLLGVHGTGAVLFASVLTLVTGFYLVLRVRFGALASCVGAVLCSVFPPVLGWEAHVGVDAWFAALLLAGFGCAARAARVGGPARTVSLVAATALGFLALAARHNAIPAVLVLLVVVVGLWLPPDRRRRRVWAAGLGLGLTVVMMGVQSGILWIVGTQSLHPAQNVMIYDLATLSKREGKMLLPKAADPGQNLSTVINATTVAGDESLIYSPESPIPWPLEGARYQALSHAWESAILHHPYGYLDDRVRSGLLLLGITHPEFWLFQEPGPTSQPRYPALDKPALSYLSATSLNDNNLYGSVIYDAWIYVLVLVAAAVVLWRRTRADRVLALLAVAVLVYTVVTIFAVPEMLYRYVYIDVVAGIVLLPVLWPRRASRPAAHRIRSTTA